ncbi:MAG: OmpA family protein [Crocinitomicaceae bacterium]|nr:OmpA family protein [Crocinitomicaceae bacterium]
MIFFRSHKLIILLFGVLFSAGLSAQANINGQWQGMMKQDGSQAISILYMEIVQSDNTISGFSKQEFPNTANYIYYSIGGNLDKDISQKNPISKKITSNQANCKYDYQLKYDENTGYLVGRYTSSTCRGTQGNVTLYRASAKQDLSEKKITSQEWFKFFIQDLQKGRKSPEMRDMERKNFKFRPIYFEYDKDELNPTDFDYLKEMARIVDGHSDLRIKITGHTDSDGSDKYNDDLSKRRAKAIKDFFLKCDIEDFKLVMDYKGKRMPVSDNKTAEGKHDNRRVDFKFI